MAYGEELDIAEKKLQERASSLVPIKIGTTDERVNPELIHELIPSSLE